MLQIISDLFINITILVALITFANQLYRDISLNISSALLRKIVVGTGFGVIGAITMSYSIQTIKGFLIDFPNIAIIISAIYNSLPAAIVASIIINIFRIFHFGLDLHNVVIMIVGLITAIGFGLIGRLHINRWKKWFLSILCACAIFLLATISMMPPSPLFIYMIVIYCSGMILVSIVLYDFMEYVIMTNQTYAEMKEAANKDYLTGLNNVRQYDKLLNDAIQDSKEKNQSLSILYLDIDYFKKINDTYGHLEGDKILKEVSVLLRRYSRSQDIISRNGGEEFSIILVGCSLEQAIEVGERIRGNVEHHNFAANTGDIINVTVSIGISSFPDTTAEIDKLVEQSDAALYDAKKTGRNRVVVAGL